MSIISLEKRYYYEDLKDAAVQLGILYKNIIRTEIIGKSCDGRDIFMLAAGRGSQNVLCVGGVHGRESVNPAVLLKMAEVYAKIMYGENLEETEKKFKKINQLKSYLQQDCIYFIPLLNPDGYEIALKGFDVIKDENYRNNAKRSGINASEWKFNARGIDINRNFPSVTWKGKSTMAEFVWGQSGLSTKPQSEPETRALIDFIKRVQSIGFIDYHSRGKIIYYYRNAMPVPYNTKQKEIADKLSSLTGYALMPPEEELDWKKSGGNTVHYYSEFQKKPAITIETIAEEDIFPLSEHSQQEVYEEIGMTPFIFEQTKTNIQK